MCKIYGYCRISTKKQNIERQVRNIQNIYPNAIIIQEAYTGTKVLGREKFNKLLKEIKECDKIVFDSVSRMSRNAQEGFKLYEELFNKGIELEFIKEPHINTTTYKQAIKNNISLTGTNVDYILEGINKYLMSLAKEQIKLAFSQAEKEVSDLKQRTKEGIESARLNGKQIGGVQGRKLKTQKGKEAKKNIYKYSRDFQGTLNDKDTMEICKISRNTYYKYKKELLKELIEKQNNN